MPCYVVAEFLNGEFSLEHKFVDYDRNTAAQILINRGFEGAKEIAAMLTNPVSRHV